MLVSSAAKLVGVFHMLSQLARILPVTLSCFLLAALSGCATQSAVPEASAAADSRAESAGDLAARVALRQVGVPYRYGGATTAGFDCSGLVQFAYAGAGKTLPRTAAAQWRHARPVADPDMQPGDILFFSIEGKMSHVGLYLGARQFVHAPSTGRTVTVASLDADFYRQAFIGAGRP